MSTSEQEAPPTGEIAGEVELAAVLSSDMDESGVQAGTVCVWGGPNFTHFLGCFVPGLGQCVMGDPPIRSARNNTDRRVHFYRDACLQRPYFHLEPGQSSSSFPFPVRAIRQNP